MDVVILRAMPVRLVQLDEDFGFFGDVALGLVLDAVDFQRDARGTVGDGNVEQNAFANGRFYAGEYALDMG